MPVITVEGPRISDLGKKRQLVQQFTDAASEAFGMSKDAIIVILHETSPECVAAGGELICDRHAARDAATAQASDA
jgi:4-oxalocrotonate tautomerase family enzyme